MLRVSLINMQTINVLLSAYNGDRFLHEQIESILQQIHPDIELFVRDDGSSDTTLSILKKYQDAGKLSFVAGKNVGVKRSFDLLLREVSDANYYAFCDQDDVWMNHKLQRAIDRISEHPQSEPVLYFTTTRLVDSELQPLHQVFPPIHRKASFGNALVQNVVTGCTAVFNHAARKLLMSKNPDWNNILMHDWWLYLVISAHGQVIFDSQPSVHYRQHGHNQVGTQNVTLSKRLGRFWRNERKITTQVKEFYAQYQESLSDNHREMLEKFLRKDKHFMVRLELALKGEVYRQRRLDNILFKFLLILNRI